MADDWHVEWLKEGVKKWNKRRKKVDFVPDLAGVNFFDLLPSDFRDSPKTSRFFEGIDLSRSILTESDLSGLNFQKANFNGADLSNSDLSMSNFSKAKFSEANLNRVDARNSNFQGAFFELVSILSVNFENANLKNVNFIEVQANQSSTARITDQGANVFPMRSDYLAFAFSRAKAKMSTQSGSGLTIKEKVGDLYDVYYGTNRNAVFEQGKLIDFNGEFSKDLSYGICEVVVPESYKLGQIGRKSWTSIFKAKSEELHIRDIVALNDELFWMKLRTKSVKDKIGGKPTIFVHGFNTSFEEAVLKAAQLGMDIGIGGGIGLYSWPSKGKKLFYGSDVETVDLSCEVFASFLEKFIKNVEFEKFNIIAHSMGCRCVLGAIDVLAKTKPQVLHKINHIILAAADVNVHKMPNFLKHLVGSSESLTAYVSEEDIPLKFSSFAHDYPRVGLTPPTFVQDGIDTIIVNKSENAGQLSHGYISRNRSVFNDMFHILKNDLPPSARHGLEKISVNTHIAWKIKE